MPIAIPQSRMSASLSKLVAYREKDSAFAAAMVLSGLIDPTILARSLGRLPAMLDPLEQMRLHSWLKAWLDRHQPDCPHPRNSTVVCHQVAS